MARACALTNRNWFTWGWIMFSQWRLGFKDTVSYTKKNIFEPSRYTTSQIFTNSELRHVMKPVFERHSLYKYGSKLQSPCTLP